MFMSANARVIYCEVNYLPKCGIPCKYFAKRRPTSAPAVNPWKKLVILYPSMWGFGFVVTTATTFLLSLSGLSVSQPRDGDQHPTDFLPPYIGHNLGP